MLLNGSSKISCFVISKLSIIHEKSVEKSDFILTESWTTKYLLLPLKPYITSTTLIL